MASIVTNTSLGEAFGGKIATMNFNYSPNSSPSSCTLTIVNENNNYIEPKLLSTFIVPKIKVPMSVVDVQYNDDSTSKTLQLELMDLTSLILDTNLILINGVHSTGITGNAVNSDFYLFYKDAGYPDSIRNPSSTPFTKQRFKRIKDGVIIGGIRTTIRVSDVYNLQGQQINKASRLNPFYTLVYDNTIYNHQASKIPANLKRAVEEAKDSYETSHEFGFTLNDLRFALNALGLRINNLPTDNILFFNSTGTVRSVLSSVLSTLGLSFYVDVFNGSINVISNNDISNINNSINNLYNSLNSGSFSDTSITSLNIKKSVRNVSGRYACFKGSASLPKGGGGGGGGGEDNPKKRVFYKFDYDYILSRKEKEFFLKIMPLFWFNFSEELINLYIYGLAKLEDPEDWSDQGEKAIYGGKFDGKTMIDQTEPDGSVNIFAEEDLPDTEPKSLTMYREIASQGGLPSKFNTREEVYVYQNTKSGLDQENKSNKNLPAEVPYGKIQPYIEAVNLSSFELYITSGLSKKKALSMDFISNAEQMTIIGPFKGSDYISSIPELLDLNTAIKRIPGFASANPKVEDLARKAGAVSRDDQYYYIGIKSVITLLEQKDFNQAETFKESIEKNIAIHSVDSADVTSYLYVTESGKRELNNIKSKCESISKAALRKSDSISQRRKSVLYTIKEGSGDDGGGDNSSNNEDFPEIHSIFSKQSSILNKTSIELDSYEGTSISAEILQQNINFFSPEQEGPFYEATVSYFRPPSSADLDPKSGFSSMSCSVSSEGVTSTISYSTVKYQKVDRQFIDKYNFNSVMGGPLRDNRQAFLRNR